MRVFIDTNIFAEYIFEREQSASVQKIFQAIKEKNIPNEFAALNLD